MPIRTDIQTQELIAQFRAQREVKTRQVRGPQASGSAAQAPAASADTFSLHSNVRLEATIRASGGTDRVDISRPDYMSVQGAHEVLSDSIMDELQRAFEKAGLEIDVESLEGLGQSQTPEATARRIVDFATRFQDAYDVNHPDEAPTARIESFISFIREAIAKGFEETREFLSGITKLSDTVDQNISKTFELTNALLDQFHQTQVDGLKQTVASAEDAEATDAQEAPADTDGTELTEGLV